LGRHSDRFTTDHPLLQAISDDPRLRDIKLIAEPWDPGPGGYQLGQFPPRWAEWNDKYRDAIRQFWRGDHGLSGVTAQRMHGSADVFESNGRPPSASVNFITSHDGYTLQDVVSYELRHNEANGEANRDGHSHNYSCNYGEEGETKDESRRSLRRQQRLNMLACLFFSQGTPMLLAGDEFGNSQQGNNNAYAQDNPTGWLDWSGLADDPEFTNLVRDLIWVRRETALLRIEDYVHDSLPTGKGSIEIRWINADGEIKRDDEWSDSSVFTLLITAKGPGNAESSLAIAINSGLESATLRLPAIADPWRISFSSNSQRDALKNNRTLLLGGRSIALLQR
jgi:glycogen operon protein